MKSVGVRMALIKWFTTYLNERSQVVYPAPLGTEVISIQALTLNYV